MKIFRNLKMPIDFTDSLLVFGACAIIFGVYEFSHPASCIVGGTMAIYAALRMGS